MFSEGTFKNITAVDCEYKGVANLKGLNLVTRAGDIEIFDSTNHSGALTRHYRTQMCNFASGMLRFLIEVYNVDEEVTIYIEKTAIGTTNTATTYVVDHLVTPGYLSISVIPNKATIHFHIKSDYRNDIMYAMYSTTITRD